MSEHHAHEKSDIRIGLAGLALGLVWIVIVAAFSHWLAL